MSAPPLTPTQIKERNESNALIEKLHFAKSISELLEILQQALKSQSKIFYYLEEDGSEYGHFFLAKTVDVQQLIELIQKARELQSTPDAPALDEILKQIEELDGQVAMKVEDEIKDDGTPIEKPKAM
jgi:cell division FtsZ-interacting protein ZapD